MNIVVKWLSQLRWYYWVTVFLLLAGVVAVLFLSEGTRQGQNDQSLVLLSGLHETVTGDVVIEPDVPFQTVEEKKEKGHDLWNIDRGSLVHWTVTRRGEEGHSGTIGVSGMLWTDLDEEGDIVIVTGLSHVTFLMSTFAVDNIPNSGIRSLFLDHIRGEEFLDVDGYPFAQFVLDEVIYGAESISSGDDVLNEVMEIYGRLKIKDVIEPVVLRDVVMEQQGDDVLFVSGTLSVSRYLWGLSLMPGVIDEFIEIDFLWGLSGA